MLFRIKKRETDETADLHRLICGFLVSMNTKKFFSHNAIIRFVYSDNTFTNAI